MLVFLWHTTELGSNRTTMGGSLVEWLGRGVVIIIVIIEGVCGIRP